MRKEAITIAPLVGSHTLKGKCPVCGQANATCGGPTTNGTGHRVMKEEAMSDEPQELYLYKVTLRGVETQVKLTRKEAKQLYGDNAEEIGPAKAHQPVEDTPTTNDSVVGSKARTAKNKAASAADK